MKAYASLLTLCLWFALAAAGQSDADRLFAEGKQKFDAGDAKAAILPLEKALALYRASHDRANEGRTLKALGNAYDGAGEYARGVDFQTQALAVARATGDRDLESRALLNIGVGRGHLGDLEGSAEAYRRSLAISVTLPTRAVETSGRTGFGVTLRKLGRYGEAQSEMRKGVELARAAANRGLESVALVFLAQTYEEVKQPLKAFATYQQLLTVTRALKNPGQELVALQGLASTAYDGGQYAKAIEYAAPALDAALALADRDSVFTALSIRGLAYTGLGDNPKALETYQESLKYARQWDDWQREVDIRNMIGLVELNLADFLKALDAHKQALEIARRHGDLGLESDALGNLGKVYVSLNALTTARDLHQQQLAAARKADDPLRVYQALQKLGDLAIQASDYTGALNVYRESLKLAPSLAGRAWEARALTHVATAYEFLRDIDRTLEFGERALKSAEQAGDQWEVLQALNVVAWALRERKDPKCIEHLNHMVELSHRMNLRSESVVLCDLGQAHLALGHTSEALGAFERSLAQARSDRDPIGQGVALDGIGEANRRQGDLAKAESALEDAVAIWEAQRQRLAGEDAFKISVFERQAATYRNLQIVQVARNRIESALETAERGRARAFVELLSRRLNNRRSGAADRAVAPVTASDIRAIARAERATLVEYSFVPEIGQLFVWVVSPEGKIGFGRAPVTEPLGQLVSRARSSLGAPSVARGTVVRRRPAESAGAYLEALHRLLVGPVAGLLPSDPAETVIFIPQGELFLVPFAALKDTGGKFLIEQHTLLTAPSIQVLDMARRRRESQPGEGRGAPALVVGNPTMPSVGSPPVPLPSLPGTETEAREVARLLDATPLLGRDATKAAVVGRLAEAGVVHLATHGLLEDLGDAGVPGAIALAPSGNDSGLLTAGEILDLKLRANMVVLSACDTGQGRITGDGVVGLSRSFITAGVPSVVVSLWPVSDASASLLMPEFYRGLQAGGQRATALRNAMLKTMRAYANPIDWAAFVLMGEP
jgi:tetratricopeptide (TPR) repeat protein